MLPLRILASDYLVDQAVSEHLLGDRTTPGQEPVLLPLRVSCSVPGGKLCTDRGNQTRSWQRRY